MKTYLLALGILIVVTKDTTIGSKTGNAETQNRPVNKVVSFLIYADGSYKAPAYKDAFAQLEIYITREEENKKVSVWGKAWQFKQLGSYPPLTGAAQERVKLGEMKVDEKLQVEYIITYFTNGSILKISRSESLVAGVENAVYVEV